MDTVAELGAENVVDETVCRDPAQARERGRADDRFEVMTIPGHRRDRARNPGLDALPDLIRIDGHSSSVARCCRYTQ